MKASLKLVSNEPAKPADILRDLLPELDRVEREAKVLRRLIDQHGRYLAKERGVAFIRFEHLKREFGQ